MSDQQESQSQASDQQPPSETFAVPDAYKDRGWVEKIKSPDDLWKMTDNAQSLLGKRPAGIPANDAPQEEWDKFYQAARPESPDKYAFSDIEGLPEGVDLTSYKSEAQKAMHKAGLTQRQADALWKEYVGLEMGAVKTSQEGLDKRFDEVAAKVLGDKLGPAQTIAQEAIKTYVSEELRTSFANNPDGMVAMIELANGYEGKIAEKDAEIERIKTEYGAEGKLPSGEQASSTDIAETVAKLSKLRLSPEAQDFTKPGHKKAMDDIAALQAIVARHYNK